MSESAVFPGDKIASIEEYEAGYNAFDDGDMVRAATVGEKDIDKEQLRAEGKPEEMLEKIAEGKIKKFYEEKVLLNQEFIKDDSKTIKELVDDAVIVLGEKIELTKFTRFSL